MLGLSCHRRDQDGWIDFIHTEPCGRSVKLAFPISTFDADRYGILVLAYKAIACELSADNA